MNVLQMIDMVLRVALAAFIALLPGLLFWGIVVAVLQVIHRFRQGMDRASTDSLGTVPSQPTGR